MPLKITRSVGVCYDTQMDYATQITALDNPKIKALVKLRRQRTRKQEGIFIAQGLREVERALLAGYTPNHFYFCPEILDSDAMQVMKQWAGQGRWFEVTPAIFSKIAGIENPQGFLATFEIIERDLSAVHELATQNDSGKAPLWLIAVGIEKPGNLGALARSASAAGCSGLLVADGIVDIYNPNAIRASTGAVFSLPIASCTSEEVIAYLKQEKITAYATTPGATAIYSDVNWRKSSAIVIGPEDCGLPEAWLDREAGASQNIVIPMAAGVIDSLNASVAAGVVLFEAVRQRLAQ